MHRFAGDGSDASMDSARTGASLDVRAAYGVVRGREAGDRCAAGRESAAGGGGGAGAGGAEWVREDDADPGGDERWCGLVGGEIRVCGEDVGSLSQVEIARRVAVVPQEPVLPEAFSALECVLMGRTPHLRLLENEGARDFEAARAAMERTETWELADRRMGELSGGERQRVVVARALAQETQVLLLDEPTAHLDIGHQASVLGLMRSLCRAEGKAVLAVVHDLTLAAAFCDRLVLLRAGGSVVAEGTPGEIVRADVLSEVYGAEVEVFAHPRTGRPVVAPWVVD